MKMFCLEISLLQIMLEIGDHISLTLYWVKELFYLFQLLETMIKNCGDIVHLQVAERDILHEMVKIVKKRVCVYSLNINLHIVNKISLMPLLLKFLAWLSCKREDTHSDRHLARSFWWCTCKISTILCSIPGALGMILFISNILLYLIHL